VQRGHAHFGNAMNGQGQLLTDIGMTFNAGAGIDGTNNQVLATLPFGGSQSHAPMMPDPFSL